MISVILLGEELYYPGVPQMIEREIAINHTQKRPEINSGPTNKLCQV
jgi:hypothetical protein